MISIWTALALYILLAGTATLVLHGSARMLVWLVVALLAVKSGLHHWRSRIERDN